MNYLPIKILAPLAVIALLGAGCASSNTSEVPKNTTNTEIPKTTMHGNTEDGGGVMSDSDHGGEHIAKLAGSRVDVKGKNDLKPGNIELSFKLYGEDGHNFGPADLKVEHEKKMHLLFVRDDMTGFQHLHPEYVNGSWTVKTMVPDQGKYQMYVDIAPIEEKASVLRVPLTIGGETQNAQVFTQDFDERGGTYLVKNGEYTVTLDHRLVAKETQQWIFQVGREGQPVTNLQPYLGAYGHVVELRHGDPDDFFHVHPVTERQPADGKVAFEGSFPVKGRYTLYAQFNINGAVKTFPINVDVTEEGQTTPVTHGSTH